MYVNVVFLVVFLIFHVLVALMDFSCYLMMLRLFVVFIDGLLGLCFGLFCCILGCLLTLVLVYYIIQHVLYIRHIPINLHLPTPTRTFTISEHRHLPVIFSQIAI